MVTEAERAEEDSIRDKGETRGSRGAKAKEAGDKAGARTLRSPTLWMRRDKEDRAETSESLLVS